MTLDERAAAMKRDEIAALLAAHEELRESNTSLRESNDELRRQLDWFKRQLFGQKSERRIVDSDERQMYLGEGDDGHAAAEESTVSVAEHRRRRRPEPEDTDDGDLRFDESVPVEEIRVDAPELEAGEGEVVTEKVSYKLAQRFLSSC